jgi:hypothetical protein
MVSLLQMSDLKGQARVHSSSAAVVVTPEVKAAVDVVLPAIGARSLDMLPETAQHSFQHPAPRQHQVVVMRQRRPSS